MQRLPSKTLFGFAIFAIGMVLVVGSVLTFQTPSHSWAAPAGFALLSVPFLTGLLPYQSRRAALAFGSYMLVTALRYGIEHAWPAQPAWFGVAQVVLLLAVVSWFVVETVLVWRPVRTRR